MDRLRVGQKSWTYRVDSRQTTTTTIDPPYLPVPPFEEERSESQVETRRRV